MTTTAPATRTITAQFVANAMNQLAPASLAGTRPRGYTAGDEVVHLAAPSIAAARVAVDRTMRAIDRAFAERGVTTVHVTKTLRVKVRGHADPINVPAN